MQCVHLATKDTECNRKGFKCWLFINKHPMSHVEYVGFRVPSLVHTMLFYFCVQDHQSSRGDWSHWERAHVPSGLDFQRGPRPNSYTVPTPTNEHQKSRCRASVLMKLLRALLFSDLQYIVHLVLHVFLSVSGSDTFFLKPQNSNIYTCTCILRESTCLAYGHPDSIC